MSNTILQNYLTLQFIPIDDESGFGWWFNLFNDANCICCANGLPHSR